MTSLRTKKRTPGDMRTGLSPYLPALLFLLLLTYGLEPVPTQAQNVEGQIVASQFGEYQVPTVGNGFSFPPETCEVSGGNRNFPAFTPGVPTKIVDTCERPKLKN